MNSLPPNTNTTAPTMAEIYSVINNTCLESLNVSRLDDAVQTPLELTRVNTALREHSASIAQNDNQLARIIHRLRSMFVFSLYLYFPTTYSPLISQQRDLVSKYNSETPIHAALRLCGSVNSSLFFPTPVICLYCQVNLPLPADALTEMAFLKLQKIRTNLSTTCSTHLKPKSPVIRSVDTWNH